jgi:hypothetical protein
MSIIEEDKMESRLNGDNFEQEGNEKEKVTRELEKIDAVRRIVEKKYPSQVPKRFLFYRVWKNLGEMK